MEKYFNWISVAAGVAGGFFANIFGGWDALLISLIVLMALDYLTGIVKAVFLKRLSSEIGFRGICKKAMMILVIAFSCILQKLTGDEIPFREITLCFFASNEGLSILENAAVLIPVPKRLREILLQLREESSTSKSEKAEQNTGVHS